MQVEVHLRSSRTLPAAAAGLHTDHDESVGPQPAVAHADPLEGFGLDELGLAARNHGMPLERMRHDVTPLGAHYLLAHYDIPGIDPATFRLEASGAVGRPLSLTLDDLRSRPSVTAPVTMECAGAGRHRNGRVRPARVGLGQVADAGRGGHLAFRRLPDARPPAAAGVGHGARVVRGRDGRRRHHRAACCAGAGGRHLALARRGATGPRRRRPAAAPRRSPCRPGRPGTAAGRARAPTPCRRAR